MGKRCKWAQNRFEADCLGHRFCFARQSAQDQLTFDGQAAVLFTELVQIGLAEREAKALASNCVLLFQTLVESDALSEPHEALDRFSLAQIAALAHCYWHPDASMADAHWEEGGICEDATREAMQ